MAKKVDKKSKKIDRKKIIFLGICLVVLVAIGYFLPIINQVNLAGWTNGKKLSLKDQGKMYGLKIVTETRKKNGKVVLRNNVALDVRSFIDGDAEGMLVFTRAVDYTRKYTADGSVRTCSSYNKNTDNSKGPVVGPFKNLNFNPAIYYPSLDVGFKTGGTYTYGGQTYKNPKGTLFLGDGAKSTKKGGGMGFGIAKACQNIMIEVKDNSSNGYWALKSVSGKGTGEKWESKNKFEINANPSGVSKVVLTFIER